MAFLDLWSKFKPRQRLTNIIIVVFVDHKIKSVLILSPYHRKGKNSMVTLTVGHGAGLTILYLDQNGNPMLVTPVPDAPPSWTDAPNPAGAAVLTVAADANSATLDAKSPGSDVVSLSLMVAGKSFSATLPFTIEAVPQVLTSIQIVAAVA